MPKETDPFENKEELSRILDDSGVPPEVKAPILEDFQTGKWEKGKRLLLSHRTRLLTSLHSEQDKLYCTDLLLREIIKKASEK